jgi:hypothetical protein
MSTESIYEEARELQAAGNHGKAAALYKKLVAVSEDRRYHIAYGRRGGRDREGREVFRQLARGLKTSEGVGA